MDAKTKQEFILLFNQGFEEIILPQLEEIREQMATKSDIDRLERKIDHLVDKSDDHEKRLNAIETVPVVAHELRLQDD